MRAQLPYYTEINILRTADMRSAQAESAPPPPPTENAAYAPVTLPTKYCLGRVQYKLCVTLPLYPFAPDFNSVM